MKLLLALLLIQGCSMIAGKCDTVLGCDSVLAADMPLVGVTVDDSLWGDRKSGTYIYNTYGDALPPPPEPFPIVFIPDEKTVRFDSEQKPRSLDKIIFLPPEPVASIECKIIYKNNKKARE